MASIVLPACVCRRRLNAAVGWAGRLAAGRVGGRPPPGRARGRTGGRHCTADQYGYVLLRRHFVMYELPMMMVCGYVQMDVSIVQLVTVSHQNTNGKSRVYCTAWTWLQFYAFTIWQRRQRHYLFGLSVHCFWRSSIHLDRYCYRDILWTHWTILIKQTGNIH